MSLEAAIYSIGIANSTLLALVGNRIVPNWAKPGLARPFCVFQIISEDRPYTVDNHTGDVYARVQFVAWATTYSELAALEAAVRGAYGNYSGTIASSTIDCIHIADVGDMPYYSDQAEAQDLHGRRLDLKVFYNE